ncbi:MAG: tRNA epoxyqueuosine(34) reductase QueG [Pyrinomonadaceae bacterium]|nr:tRNA epoxyqueuosine(34) reductase QueG [Pyrinomonadaceae bacterium]
MDFSSKIKAKALEIGFHKVGIARAEELTLERERFENWLAKGLHGEMKWLEREPEKRSNPQVLFPEAKSVVVVALNYFTPHEHETDANKGKISRYAWGDDYHDVLTEKLRELLDWIQTETPETTGKICVDTAPMLDKAWAQRAGLGWIGKNSNLITRDFGSWVFLGELLLNIELDYDLPETIDFCGNCRLCLDACPTNAIIEPRVVDSNACISYANIESRTDEISPAIVENLNGWLYGCDICQDVCPWNRFEKPTSEIRFEPRPDNVSPDLTEIIKLTPETYAKRFRQSSIKRAKLGGLQRNARALLVNSPKQREKRNK